MSALHDLYRKPSKLTLTVAGVTVAVSVAVSAGVAAAAPGAAIDQAASLHPAASGQLAAGSQSAERAGMASYPEADQHLTPTNAAQREIGALIAHRVKAERVARRAAARRAAARWAAAQQAAAQQPQAGSAPAQAPAPSGAPQQIAMGMLGSYGWPASQFSCLNSLWNAESGWNPSASNPSTGAYGIAQALPGSKMASAGADWETNPATQIRWGLGYIQQLYGSPCGAWAHEEASGWY